MTGDDLTRRLSRLLWRIEVVLAVVLVAVGAQLGVVAVVAGGCR